MVAGTILLAAMADLHYSADSQGKYSREFARIREEADALLLCGDLVHHGLPAESRILITDLMPVVRRIPVIAVLGNHEFESSRPDEVSKILTDGGIRVLDGDACEIQGVGIAGVKGFGGGFGDHRLEPWGEEVIKAFVREADNEAMKLESALAKLPRLPRVVLLHYSPISTTVAGEPPEIFPFLGSSRLEEVLNRNSVTAVFHGHAHQGTAEGKTKSGIPVYNVAVRLLERVFPNRPPYRTLELAVVQSTL
jgi:Icc-related predicted phosphoesterase